MKYTAFLWVLHSVLIAVFAIMVCVPAAHAQKSPSIIRDTEIEAILKNWSEPVIKAADLEPSAIKFILVQDDNVNAFVAGGQNIFIYTGLLLESEQAAEVIGVIAHELGHIRGGHLVRTREALENASYESFIGTILGIGAALVTGEGGAAAVFSAGMTSTAQRRFLAFSRVQEASADQAGLSYLESAEINPAGLHSFMEKLENQELLPVTQQSEYIRTHPLTRDRIATLKHGLEDSKFKDKAYPEQWEEDYKRIRAKLIGFIKPEQVSWVYPDKDKSVTARYARSIAAYRQNNLEDALKNIDSLLEEEPHNPYFLELKGQILFEYGQVPESIPYYRQAIEIYPEGALLRIAYAHGLIEAAGYNDTESLQEAILQLRRALQDEPRSSRSFRLLATAHGRLGNKALADLFLAEEALLMQKFDTATRLANNALNGLEESSSGWFRAKDILATAEREQQKAQKKK